MKGWYSVGVILDAAVVIILIVFIVDGYKRGLVNAVVRMLCSLLSAIGSIVISSFGAVFVYNMFVKERVVDSIGKAIPAALENTALKNPAEVYSSLPDYIKNCMSLMGISQNELVRALGDTTLTAASAVESLIRPILVTAVMVACSLLLFIAIDAVALLLTKSLTTAVSLSDLSTTNKICGALLGIIQAAVMVLIMSLLIYAALVALPAENASRLSEGIDNTFVFKYVHQLNIPAKVMTFFGVSGL